MRRVLVLLAVVVAAAAACGGPETGGRDATRSMVLETCAPGGEPVETAVCRCAYDAVAERYDDDELEELDLLLRDDPEALPDDVRAAVLDCGFEAVAPP